MSIYCIQGKRGLVSPSTINERGSSKKEQKEEQQKGRQYLAFCVQAFIRFDHTLWYKAEWSFLPFLQLPLDFLARLFLKNVLFIMASLKEIAFCCLEKKWWCCAEKCHLSAKESCLTMRRPNRSEILFMILFCCSNRSDSLRESLLQDLLLQKRLYLLHLEDTCVTVSSPM